MIVYQKGILLLRIGILAAFIGGISGCIKSQPTDAPIKPGGLQVGDKAYAFSLMDENGNMVRLGDVQPGWCLVLILYRGHWCGACLNQLLNLKSDYSKFQAAHAALAAVSVDSLQDSADFNNQWRFPFPLLADPQFQVIDAYGARHPDGHDGHDISRPSVIIIDPQKTVRYKYIGRNPTDRPEDDEILYTVQQILQNK